MLIEAKPTTGMRWHLSTVLITVLFLGLLLWLNLGAIHETLPGKTSYRIERLGFPWMVGYNIIRPEPDRGFEWVDDPWLPAVGDTLLNLAAIAAFAVWIELLFRGKGKWIRRKNANTTPPHP